MTERNFDEVAFECGGEGTPVKMRVTRRNINGFRRVSSRDFIAVVCGKKDSNQACEVWRRLPKQFRDELGPYIEKFKFTGRGQQYQPVLSLEGCLKLLMVLNNNHAKLFRVNSLHILIDFFTNDSQFRSQRVQNNEDAIQNASNATENSSETIEHYKLAGGVYVLELEGLPYTRYVGKSENIEARIAAHRSGGGAKCTQNASRITRIPALTQGSCDDLDSWERLETLHQMFMHGIDSVRGWHYVASTPKLPDVLRKEAIKNICSARDLCARCGHSGHFIMQCSSNHFASWMLQ